MPTRITNTLGPQFAPAYHRPWLRYVEATPGAEAATPPAAPAAPDDKGFPADTPTEEMTPDQRAAYWRNMSKTKQRDLEAFEKLGLTADQVKELIDNRDAAARDALTDQERAVTDARAEGKAEGAREARGALLAQVVEASLIAQTRTADEEYEDARARVASALKFVDVTKFTADDDSVDADSVAEFASTIAPIADSTPASDPLRSALDSLGAPSTPAGSVAAYEKRTYESLANKQ